MTWAGSGIGRATARRLASEGALVGRHRHGGVVVAENDALIALLRRGRKSKVYVCDISDSYQVRIRGQQDRGGQRSDPRSGRDRGGSAPWPGRPNNPSAEWSRIIDVNLRWTLLQVSSGCCCLCWKSRGRILKHGSFHRLAPSAQP